MSCYLFIRKRSSVIRLEIQLFGDRQQIQQTSLNTGKYEWKNCDSIRRKFREAIKRMRMTGRLKNRFISLRPSLKIENYRHCSGQFSQNRVNYVRRSFMYDDLWVIYESMSILGKCWPNEIRNTETRKIEKEKISSKKQIASNYGRSSSYLTVSTKRGKWRATAFSSH